MSEEEHAKVLFSLCSAHSEHLQQGGTSQHGCAPCHPSGLQSEIPLSAGETPPQLLAASLAVKQDTATARHQGTTTLCFQPQMSVRHLLIRSL